MEDFDALIVELSGTNLIEASAGTGKTYSLAILALRMIAEKSIPLPKILMVTFTNAATAELEVRIRLFVRKAFQYSHQNLCDDNKIMEVVNNANLIIGVNAVRENLQAAVNNLDETSVMTIHSFCQNLLNEFQFETGQTDRTGILGSIEDLRKRAVNEFWRTEISTLNREILELLLKKVNKIVLLDKMTISKVVEKTMSGRSFLCKTTDPENALQELNSSLISLRSAERDFEEHVMENYSEFLQRGNLTEPARKFLIDVCNGSPENFIIEFRKKIKRPGYFTGCFSQELRLLEQIDTAQQANESSTLNFRNALLAKAAKVIGASIIDKLKVLNLATYDQLISRVHDAVIKDNEKLSSLLNEKYKAVFIDEFQDTDKLQYEIFNNIFNNKAILFYIGDPKQSIYGWRSADLDTYIEARGNIEDGRCFSMDENFRSTESMVAALNHFFQPVANFDAFQSEDIRYHTVRSGRNQGELFNGGNPVIPITIVSNENQDEIIECVVREISNLLTNDQIYIQRNGNQRAIVPSDITILVRDGNQGKSIKSLLRKSRIPAIVADDSKILKSQEVKSIRKLMATVIRPNRKSINSLLADDLFAVNLDDLKKLDDEKLLNIFNLLRETWNESGAYVMLSRFLRKFGLIEKCLSGVSNAGQRTLTNFIQIMEILHDEEVRNKLKAEDLYAWLGKATRIVSEEDESQLRIESDDNAVRIMTIHKCKGLTFNIVFAPFLDFYKHSIKKGIEFKNEEGSFCFTFDIDDDNQKLYSDRLTGENHRLIYVAMTRAVYKTYLNSNAEFPESELQKFMKEFAAEGFQERTTGFIEFLEAQDIESGRPNIQIQNRIALARALNPEVDFKQTWKIHSFSSLSGKHEKATSEPVEIIDAYNKFVFSDLPKGAKAGLFLHSIFETLDFTRPDTYEEQLTKAAIYYPSLYDAEQKGNYLQLIRHCMEVKIGDGPEAFSLNQVEPSKKLPELDFYFSFDNHKKNELARIIPDIEFTTDPEIEGVMHGFIDLFFEHNGKFYIVDWKSNFLGNRLEDYQQNGLLTGMRGNNYHLQYYIYTIAMKRFLEKKLPTFDYEKDFGGAIYLFLRGVRNLSNCTGVFYARPTTAEINRIEELFKLA
jgi:exodeoxyribonuclease V beta subunit